MHGKYSQIPSSLKKGIVNVSENKKNMAQNM